MILVRIPQQKGAGRRKVSYLCFLDDVWLEIFLAYDVKRSNAIIFGLACSQNLTVVLKSKTVPTTMTKQVLVP